jgi:aminoglycoside/choline kinase family phosphotransferase
MAPEALNAKIGNPKIISDNALDRFETLRQWLATTAIDTNYSLVPASSDASFRRYFRLQFADAAEPSLIVMDAPPAHENCAAFVHVAQLMRDAGLNVPRILAQDLDNGFLLLSDLGTKVYIDVLDADNADALFRDALATLVKWQLATRPGTLPPYDEALLRRELNLFPDWYVTRQLKVEMSAAQKHTLETMFQAIMKSNLAQPAVYVHRDFMPRNLMLTQPNPGVLDFQDAVTGPIAYDVVSLFRDAFISWEEERVLDWSIRYWEMARGAGLPVAADFGDFYRDFEWMGLQRHLKVLGIFARICHRDGKPRYIGDAPRFLAYIRAVATRYNALTPLARLLDALERQANPS